jgi:hypothetical protein
MEILKRGILGAFSILAITPMSHLQLIFLAGATGFLALSAQASPLTEAHVTKIINKVQVVDPAKGPHPAALRETIKDDIELKTGVKSRSELVFQDETLTRLGPETSFSFKAGTRDLSLEKGTMLLQVPKGLGGAKIRTAAVTAAITGTTIMMEYTPGKHIKVLVLEGSLRLSINGRFGDSVVLRPGRMVLMRPDAKRIPPPVSVDLKKIVNTSSLVNMSKKKGGTSLPSAGLIEKEIAQQAHDKGTKDLVETDVVIHGSGTMALNSTGNIIDVLARNEQGRSLTVATTTSSGSTGSISPAATPAPTPSAISSGPTPTPAPTPASAPASTPAPTPSSAPGSTPAPASSPRPTATPQPSATPGLPDDDDKDKDKDKGDHNGDGHGDNGKGGGKKNGRHLSLPPPAVDRVRPSGRETVSPMARFSRNER